MIGTPALYLEITKVTLWSGTLNEWTQDVIVLFAQGKFYTMLSFLFGFGFMIFMDRASQGNNQPHYMFLRRMLLLFFLGLLHALFFWWGDILMTYALSGLLLMVFFHAKPRSMIIWAIIFTSTYLLFFMLSVALMSTMVNVQPDITESQMLSEYAKYVQQIDASLYAYGQGSFSDMMNQRLQDLKLAIPNGLFTMMLVLPMFLLGAYTYKIKLLPQLRNRLSFIRKVWLWGLVIGLSLNGLKLWAMKHIDPMIVSNYDVIQVVGMTIGDPALSLFYMASIVLLMERARWLQRLMPFASVGRLALTNYLLQTVICTTIFYSYGLGLYGKVGPFAGLFMSIVIFALQLYLSMLWLSKFRLGPVEWLLRSFTYGSVQRLKR